MRSMKFNPQKAYTTSKKEEKERNSDSALNLRDLNAFENSVHSDAFQDI